MKIPESADVTPAVLDEYVNRLLVDGLKRSTIRTRLYALRVFFRFLHSRGRIPTNPADTAVFRIPPDDRDRKPVWVLEPDEVELMLAVEQPAPERGEKEPEAFFRKRLERATAATGRARALFVTVYVLALRISEAAALRVEDVSKDCRRVVLRSSKRSDHPEVLDLDDRAAEVLAAWIRVRGRRPGSLFQIGAWACGDTLRRLAKTAKIPKRFGRSFHAHAARASRATHAAEHGASLEQVARLLRHRRIESATRYVRAATRKERRRVAVLSLPWNAKKVGAKRVGLGSLRKGE